MSKPIIQIEGVGKRYRIGANREPYLSLREEIVKRLSPAARRARTKENEFWALRDVGLDVHRGEAVGIIGRNGAGKSTLLKILSRITPPSEGRVVMRGRVASLLEVGTGFHPELTGRENVFLNGAVLGMTRKEIVRKFDDIVSFAEVERFLDTPVKRYSSGMYVRLAFAVAAHLEPEIMVVDEVLAVGDAAFQKKCIGKMGDVAKEGRTVLFVSHNMAAIENLCPRSVLLDRARVVVDGETGTTVQRYLKDCFFENHGAVLADRTDRTGSGRVRLVDVKFLDGNLNETSFVSSGSPCGIDFHYASPEAVRDVSIAFTVRDNRTQFLFRPSSADTGHDGGPCPRNGTLRCEIPRLPLVPGQYRITVEIRVGGIVADYVEGAAVLAVAGGDFFGTGRMNMHSPVLLDHSWRVIGRS